MRVRKGDSLQHIHVILTLLLNISELLTNSKHVFPRTVQFYAVFHCIFAKVREKSLCDVLDVAILHCLANFIPLLMVCYCTFFFLSTKHQDLAYSLTRQGKCCEIISLSPASEYYFINTLSFVLKKQQANHNTLFTLIM